MGIVKRFSAAAKAAMSGIAVTACVGLVTAPASAAVILTDIDMTATVGNSVEFDFDGDTVNDFRVDILPSGPARPAGALAIDEPVLCKLCEPIGGETASITGISIGAEVAISNLIIIIADPFSPPPITGKTTGGPYVRVFGDGEMVDSTATFLKSAFFYDSPSFYDPCYMTSLSMYCEHPGGIGAPSLTIFEPLSSGPFGRIGDHGFIGLRVGNTFGFAEITRGSITVGTIGVESEPDTGAEIVGAAPEPAAALLAASGVAGILIAARRRG